MNENVNVITEKIIGCAINIHKELGPGLLESIYESAMCIELNEINLYFESQKPLQVIYKGKTIGIFTLDLVVDNKIGVELKSTERMVRFMKRKY